MVEKKSILLIMPYGSVGGMERLALNFYNYYISKGYKVKALKLIKLKTDIINFEKDECFFSEKDFFEMSFMQRMLFYAIIPFKIRKLIKKENITHSIAFGDMANIFSSLTFTKEFKVASIHALKSVEFANKTFLNKVFKIGFKTSYKHFNRMVCISTAIKEDLIKNCDYKFNNLDVIYNPHNIDQINNLAKEPITEQKEIEIFKKPTILFLGRLSIQKAPWHLLNAFRLVLENKLDVNLVFVGDGDASVKAYLENLIEKFKLNENVFFLGRKQNPYKYIKASTVLALSSFYEGTPNVIVEAISIGTPIVSTNCTNGISEIMSINENITFGNNIITETGIITPNLFKGVLKTPSSSDNFISEEIDFSKALIDILDNTMVYKNQIESHKNNMLNKFDLSDVAIKYIS